MYLSWHKKDWIYQSFSRESIDGAILINAFDGNITNIARDTNGLSSPIG